MVFVIKILRILKRVPFLGRTFFDLGRSYIDTYRNFSYDKALNGEQNLQKKCAEILPVRPIVMDVGANVGKWTRHFLKLKPKAVIHLFELSQSTFNHLKKNLSGKNLVLNNVALSNSDGIIEYSDYGESSVVNTIILNESYNHRKKKLKTATSITGDKYMNKNDVSRIDLLKIDVEGAEYQVLSGFSENLSHKNIKIIQFEYGYINGDAKTLMKDFFQLFESYGYSVGRLCPKGVNFKAFEYSDNDFKSGPNYVACLPEYVDYLKSF
jgi:FkbM family methyltransferase